MCAVPAQDRWRRLSSCVRCRTVRDWLAAAAELLGIEVWALGGPQAIGWLAYVERVDKIVGSGNAYVNEAKSRFRVTCQLICRAGHLKSSVGGDPRVELGRRAAERARAGGMSRSHARGGGGIAPEHLVLLGAPGKRGDVRNAGAVFVGPWSAVPAGDYATGATCPDAAGRARWAGSGWRHSSSR
jgi:histidinol dehydrogenase